MLAIEAEIAAQGLGSHVDSGAQKGGAWARDRTPHRRAHILPIDAAVTARARLRSDISNLRTGITKHQRGCGNVRDEKKGQKAHDSITYITGRTAKQSRNKVPR